MKAVWDCADTSAAKSYYTTATSANIHTAMAGTSLQSQVQALTGADAGLDALIVAAFDGTGAFAAAAAAGADGCPVRGAAAGYSATLLANVAPARVVRPHDGRASRL